MKQIVMYSPANFSPRKTGEISTKARPMTVLDYGFLAVDFGFQVLDSNLFLWNLDSGFQSFSVEPGFWIPIFSGIPDSLCCIRIPKPRIQESMSILFPDSRIRIPLHAVIRPMKGYSSEQGSRVAGASNQLSGGGSCPFWLGVFLCCCCYCFLFAIKPQSGLYEFRDALAQLLRS